MKEFCYISKGKLNIVQEGIIGDVFVQQYTVNVSGNIIKDESPRLIRTMLSVNDLYNLYSATYETRPMEEMNILLRRLEMLESLVK
jgi:uncharacterized Rmd1/YagE family protein